MYLRNGARYDHSYNEVLIGSRMHAFDSYQNRWPWMTLNGLNALCCRKDASIVAHCSPAHIWMKIDPLSATKYRPMFPHISNAMTLQDRHHFSNVDGRYQVQYSSIQNATSAIIPYGFGVEPVLLTQDEQER